MNSVRVEVYKIYEPMTADAINQRPFLIIILFISHTIHVHIDTTLTNKIIIIQYLPAVDQKTRNKKKKHTKEGRRCCLGVSAGFFSLLHVSVQRQTSTYAPTERVCAQTTH